MWDAALSLGVGAEGLIHPVNIKVLAQGEGGVLAAYSLDDMHNSLPGSAVTSQLEFLSPPFFFY